MENISRSRQGHYSNLINNQEKATCMKISPGKLINCSAIGDKLTDRSTRPRTMPATTEETVSTSSRLSLIAFLQFHLWDRPNIERKQAESIQKKIARKQTDLIARRCLFMITDSKGWRNLTVRGECEDFCSQVLSLIAKGGGTRTKRQETIMRSNTQIFLARFPSLSRVSRVALTRICMMMWTKYLLEKRRRFVSSLAPCQRKARLRAVDEWEMERCGRWPFSEIGMWVSVADSNMITRNETFFGRFREWMAREKVRAKLRDNSQPPPSRNWIFN